MDNDETHDDERDEPWRTYDEPHVEQRERDVEDEAARYSESCYGARYCRCDDPNSVADENGDFPPLAE